MTGLRAPGLLGVAVDLNGARADRAMEVTRIAEGYQADFVSVPDHPYAPGELDTWTMLTTLAARSRHIAVASNVTALPLRPPVMLAKAVASLQVLSGGRAVLGVGAGDPQAASFGAPSWSPGEAVSALDEAIRLVRELWTTPRGSRTSFDGTFYQAPQSAFGPVPDTPPPIWVGAFGPRMLTLTGRLADGWIPTNAYLELADVPKMQRRIDDAADRAGRDPRDVRRILNVMGSISDTAPSENGRRLTGPVSSWVDALGDCHQRLGFDSFTFWPVAGDRVTQVSRFFEQVRPQLDGDFQPTIGAAPCAHHV